MTISFTEVGKALDEAVEMEDGTRIERLCVAIARRRWPNLIATETKKDGGEDAIYIGSQELDEGTPGIAVSMTNTLVKVRNDARAIVISGIKIGFLVFYTPKKVTNTTAKAWAKKVREEFDHGLIVISREEIIQSLIEPDNAFICESILGLEVSRSQDLERIIGAATSAAGQVAEQWLSRLPVSSNQLISLLTNRLDDQGRRTGEVAGINRLKTKLIDSERLLLLGGPGAGKSTTLSMMAVSVIDDPNEIVPVLISIPEWIDARMPILDFVASQLTFRSEDINSDALALLAQLGQLIFLLNGWNEVGAADLERASREIKKLEREYPAVGMLISSRQHKVDPFNMGAARFELAEVSDSQREAYIESVIPDRAKGLLQQFEDSSSLDSLSRVPFILELLVALYASNDTLPQTKAEVLEAIIESFARSDEHAAALAGNPLRSFATDYMEALAAEMTAQGRASLTSQRACQIVSDVSTSHVQSGQRTSPPGPLSVLESLCAHYLLEMITYPEQAFRYSHQQFQESFAAGALRAKVLSTLQDTTGNAIAFFQSEFINIPVWEESLLLLAEGEGAQGSDQAKTIVSNLVEWTTIVDPVFAARLYNNSNRLAQDVFDSVLQPLLRRWYECESSAHKACAIAAMIASGSERFADIIWSVLEDPDRDVRLSTLDATGPIPLSILGDEWATRIEGWSSDQRIEFVETIGHSGSYDGIEVAHALATSDMDPAVRIRAIEVLWFEGAWTKLFAVLTSCDDEVFSELTKRDHLPRSLPEHLIRRRNETLGGLITASADIRERLRLSTRLFGYGEYAYVEQVKANLDQMKLSQRDTQLEHSLYEVIKLLRLQDAEWVDAWVTQRILAGNLMLDYWVPMCDRLDGALVESMLDDLLNPEINDRLATRATELLSSHLDETRIKQLLYVLVAARRLVAETPNPKPENIVDYYNRIVELVRAMPLTQLVTAVASEFSALKNEEDLREILKLLGVNQVADVLSDSVREELDAPVLEALQQGLRGLMSLVRQADDFEGGLRADLSVALGRFGAEEDIQLIEELINSDIERVQLGLELIRSGQRNTVQASRVRISWSTWHLGALIKLAGVQAEEFILGLLDQKEYEHDAIRALFELVRMQTKRKDFILSGRDRYKEIFGLRDAGGFVFKDEVRRQNYAEAVLQHLAKMIAKGEQDPDYSNARVKGFAADLSLFRREQDAQLILDSLALPSQWDAWEVISTVETLVIAGIELDSNTVKGVLEPIVQKLMNNGTEFFPHNDQQYLLTSCVAVLLFTSQPETGVELLQRLSPGILAEHALCDVVEIAGYSNAQAAATFLVSLWQTGELGERLVSKIISALGRLNFAVGNEAILALVGLSEENPPAIEISREHIEPAAAAIASIISTNEDLVPRLIERCDSEMTDLQRNLMATVIQMIRRVDVDIAALQMIRDGSELPWALSQRIKQIFFDEISIPGMQGAYELSPRTDTEIRSRLLEMVAHDPNRQRTAFDLLGNIDIWRLESGKPDFEPRHPCLPSGIAWPIELIDASIMKIEDIHKKD